MPKYVIHVLVMKKGYEDLGVVMENNMRISTVGAVRAGLFLWASDYVVCQVLLKFYNA